MARGHFRHKDTLDVMARKTRGQEILVIRRTQLTFNIAVTTKGLLTLNKELRLEFLLTIGTGTLHSNNSTGK